VAVTEELLACLDALPEPILLVTTDGRIAGTNRALVQELGAIRASLTGRALAEIADDSSGHVRDYLGACIRSGQMVPGSLTLRTNDGAPIEYRAHGAAYQPRAGEARQLLIRLTPKRESVAAFITLNEKIAALIAEVARRKQAEVSLGRQRETLEVTLASIGDGVIVTDAVGRVTFMNPVAERLTGWPLAAVAERPLAEIFQVLDERTGEPIGDPVKEVLATGCIAGLGKCPVLIRQDGSRVPVDDSAAPIRLPDGVMF
jgi:PAS domain S-box-containing protein